MVITKPKGAAHRSLMWFSYQSN